MSWLDGPPRGLSVVFVRYDQQKHEGAWTALERHLRLLGGGAVSVVIVDNAREGMAERRLAAGVVEIGGDNRAWEFSAFDRGVEHLRSHGGLYDLTLLITDAFRAYGDGFLGFVDPQVLRYCRRHGAATGWIDSFMEPCTVLGTTYEAWFRTSYLLLPTAGLGALMPFAWPLPMERIFSGDPGSPWCDEAPLSANLRRRLLNWLTLGGQGDGEEDGAPPGWHSRFRLTGETLPFFEAKACAILREHLLTTRLRVGGTPAYDLRVLSEILLRGDRPAADGSDQFLEGLQNWLARRPGAGEAPSTTVEREGPSLIFRGSLERFEHVAAARRFSSEVMPLVLQRFPGARFELATDRPPMPIASLAGLHGTTLTADGGGEAPKRGGVMVAPPGSRGIPGREGTVGWVDLESLGLGAPAVEVARQCCAVLAGAEQLAVERPSQRGGPSLPGVESPEPAVFSTEPLRWRNEYLQWLEEHESELDRRHEHERGLVTAAEAFLVHALCHPCGQRTAMHVDFDYGGDPASRRPNWRERLVCQECGLNSKVRGVLHVLDSVVVPRPQPRVLIWASDEDVPKVVRNRFGGSLVVTTGEELSGAAEAGSCDCLLVLDMFERAPDLDAAVRTSLDLLRPGGGMAFSAAFRSDRQVTRAASDDRGVRRVFGWEVLDHFRLGGFEDVVAHFFWSPQFGYLGVEQVVFVARKAESVG